MRFAAVPLDRRDLVFRYSLFRAVVGAVSLAALAAGAFMLGRLKGVWLAYYIAALAVIFLIVFHKLVTARFQPSNWLLRMTDSGLFIQFRSYLNHHFKDDDLTVAFVPYSEIRSAQSVKERQEHPDGEGSRRATTSRTRRIVELELAGDTSQLGKALARERERLFSKSVIGAGRISTRYQHLPVTLASAKRLRIEWGVVPNAQTLLDALTRHTLVRGPAVTSKDLLNIDNLSKDEQEARLMELAEAGDVIGAVTLARQLYSYDLTTAKQFVEELMNKQAAPR